MDDDLILISEDWLRSAGFSEKDDWFNGMKHADGMVIVETDGSVHLVGGDGMGLKNATKARTRGEVRRLCEVFHLDCK